MRLVRPSGLLVLSLLLVACSGSAGGAASTSGAPEPASAAASASAEAAPPTIAPGPSASGASGGGGAVGGSPGSGATTVPIQPPIQPVPIQPIGPGQTPGPIPSPSPDEVHPVAGLLNAHDVRATALKASAANGHLSARVFWWSGPPPCSELAEVKVERSGSTFTLTVREGARDLGVACIALAMYKVTTVDLGPISPGSYTVDALGVDRGIVVSYTG